MSEWRDIKTAPKDGSAILLFVPDKPVRDMWRGHVFDDPRFCVGYWRTWYSQPEWGNRNDAHFNPTHWMPLPEPPK